MQTFMPFSSFYDSADVLDDRRLNKQIIEAYQIVSGKVPNKNHPACLMWKDHKYWLNKYIKVCCLVYYKRTKKTHSILNKLKHIEENGSCPEFIFDKRMTISHKVNLIRKGVNVDFLTDELYKEFYSIADGSIYSTVKIEDFPEGYYWPVQPVGIRAQTCRNNWIQFFNNIAR